jgi:cold shock CspA family protein
MQRPPEINLQDLPDAEKVEASILRRIERLDGRYDRLVGCRVVLEPLNRGRHSGTLYRVRIDLAVPGRDVQVNREPGLDHAHEDPFVAVRDAFDAAERQLERLAEEERGEVKHHEPLPEGRVVRLEPREGYGLIQTADGEEVSFQRNAVLEGFERLQVGSRVRFAAVEGDEGLAATTVHVAD